ncbi:ureidoglycolate lyase [Xinfangfangia sp. CPCC 101601]|uniref:Ureidoglycolate lyase n=1 Tax=Pseudogemmobacter lacusdianii TaxID=3069608 RepID=A0ABU0VZW8_9RHOB|nr:ureidoglycolate lyase [Xinfangfangia sp. CPCC 101601]MDQ2067302.1 ureidoglycolate lyase [Xinfangfangia sp. CPCC 101601]
MILRAEDLTAMAFAPFGRVYDLRGAEDPGVKASSGDGWSDRFIRGSLIDGAGSLGRTVGPSAPWDCHEMERHPLTEEALFCAENPIVLAVAPSGEGTAPLAHEVRGFILRPGQVAVMYRNIWHDACRGLHGPTAYYWMAQTGLGIDPWVEVAGGAVRVEL